MNATLPPGNVIATKPSQGACSPIAAVGLGTTNTTTFVTCALGSLGPGATATVAIVWASTEAGLFSVASAVAGAEPDLDTTNNTREIKTSVATELLLPIDVATLPVLGEVVGITPAAGDVRVRKPGDDEFVPLDEVGPLPTGSRVDARGGRVELTSVDADGAIRTGEFRGSVFDLKQRKNGQVVLTLKNGDFKVCGSGKKLAAGKGQAVRTTQRFVKRFGGRVIRKLWGRTKARAKFRTRGRYSAATVRGTAWITIDRCGGTEIRVKKGKVAVRDVVRKRTRIVKANPHRQSRPELSGQASRADCRRVKRGTGPQAPRLTSGSARPPTHTRSPSTKPAASPANESSPTTQETRREPRALRSCRHQAHASTIA